MIRNLLWFVLVILIQLPVVLFAQNEKPKIALVLSGGGAKGVAHIPVLQALDSLHIVPDIVVGTSMGSVIGGLYAMGYSGDEIAYLVNTTEWNNLLYEKTPFNDVSVEEKSENEKYLIGLDIVDGAPKTTPYLLNDQNLRLKLGTLTAPFYKDTNFDDLPIPFRSVTTDLINFKEIVLKDGSLATAMRASMSIPGVFEPVKYKNTILVDGGILNNFPTNIAKEWGADIIIGSDVSGGAQDIEGLDNISDLLFQTTMVQNYRMYPSNRALVNIMIDHVPNLTYSTGDFNKTTELYEEGKIASKEKIGELAALGLQLARFKQREIALPVFKDSVSFGKITYKNISEDNLQLLKSRMGLEEDHVYTSEDLVAAIKRSMGTDIFRKIYLDLSAANNEELVITGFEKSNHRLNASVHYDLYRGIGLVGNYTGRNLLGEASRVLVTLDIAEQPKGMLQVQKNFGEKKQWWWRSEGIGKQLIQRIFINGQYADDYREKSVKFKNQINRNINSLSSYAGLGFNYEYVNIDPTANSEFRDNLLVLNQYYASYVGFDAHFFSNTMDKVFYPKQGTSINATVNRSIKQRASVFFSDAEALSLAGLNYGFTNLQGNYHKRLPLGNKVTGIFEASMGFTIADKDEENEISFYNAGFPQLFYLGGNLPILRSNTVGFQGLQEDEVITSQFIVLKVASQLDVFNNFYITPNINLGSIGFSDLEEFSKNVFSPRGSWEDSDQTSLLFSIGTMVSYKSILGPVDLSFSWTNDINKVRVFLSVGIPFNR
ncbi:NTE family protein [Muriicola jejuensis]|uniref:Patatin n=1 Tax=Muriicola jejuensis TaxID=504488 RepID=A0A6P0UFM8_9FLAO|nr:patatin-like phospholipase family protein [Muriicola jejuensis]NER08906.1 patatin [Muriicola jejuensis]SMP12996.1 NTE family protein [Muriicola jejuensis]